MAKAKATEAEPENLENKPLQFDIMPGADLLDEEPVQEMVDLNFLDTDDTGDENADETETVAEDETAETEASDTDTDEETEDDTEEETEDGTEEETDGDDSEDAEEDDDNIEEEAEEVRHQKIRVPKERLDKEIASRREAEDKIKTLEQMLDDARKAPSEVQQEEEKTVEFDFDTKEAEYQEAVLDGESARATELRKEIRAAEREQYLIEARKEAKSTVSQSTTQARLDTAANQLVKDFPVFDSKSKVYDQKLTTEVLDMRDGMIAMGKDPVESLIRATKFIASENGLLQLGTATTETDTDTDTETNKTTKAEADKKRAANTKKKVKAANSQPPTTDGEGNNSRDKAGDPDLMSLTEDEFDALPEGTLRRLRGDIV